MSIGWFLSHHEFSPSNCGEFSVGDIILSPCEIFVNTYYLKKIIYGWMIPWHDQPMKRTKNRIISMNCIEKWMKSNGLTIPLIASKCGIPESIVRNWVSQKEIPMKFANCLQELLQDRTTLLSSALEGIAMKGSNLISL